MHFQMENTPSGHPGRLDFQPISLSDRALFNAHMQDGRERGCEYSFPNLYLWGRQCAVQIHNYIALFSEYDRRSVYPYPIGSGDVKPVLDAILADARARGISCCITNIVPEEKQLLEMLYPGKFCYHCDRDAFDYVYSIHDLADLKGKKYHGKRNHFTRFQAAHPEYRVEPLCEDNLDLAHRMAEKWYETRMQEDPSGDYSLEKNALYKAFRHFQELHMDGLLLLDGSEVLAVTLGSRINDQIFDVHFEKARGDVDGAYVAINCEFARYIRNQYPGIQFLNREDDMGIEGLRTAKLSYKPHHMIEKYWACQMENDDDD